MPSGLKRPRRRLFRGLRSLFGVVELSQDSTICSLACSFSAPLCPNDKSKSLAATVPLLLSTLESNAPTGPMCSPCSLRQPTRTVRSANLLAPRRSGPERNASASLRRAAGAECALSNQGSGKNRLLSSSPGQCVRPRGGDRGLNLATDNDRHSSCGPPGARAVQIQNR